MGIKLGLLNIHVEYGAELFAKFAIIFVCCTIYTMQHTVSIEQLCLSR